MGNHGLLPYVFLWVEVLILLYHLNLVKIVLLTHQILYLVVLQVCQNLAQIVPQIPCPEGLLVEGLLHFQQNYYTEKPYIQGRLHRPAMDTHMTTIRYWTC